MEGPFQAERFLMLIAQTPIHVGAGPTVSPVDLPTQREAATYLPIIRGSELRGALAQRLFHRSDRGLWKDLGSLVFGYASRGPEGGRAGSFNVLDAHILLFPSPSLYGAYAYLTCPLLLHRFSSRAAKRAPELVKVASELAEYYSRSRDDSKVVVEEGSEVIGERGACLHPLLRFNAVHDKRLNELSELLTNKLREAGLSAHLDLRGHLALLSDDAASYVIRHSMVLQPRVRMDYERKTVEVGPWLEECIPRHTILYTSIILAWEGRLSLSIPLKRKDELKDLIDRLLGGGPVEISMKCDLEKGACRLSLSPDHVLRLLLPERGALFLGGNVTVGRGLLEVGAI